MWETIRGYLTFTRKERYGVLFLLLLITIVFVLPYFLKPAPGDPDPAAYENLKEGIRKFESRPYASAEKADSVHRYKNGDGDEGAEDGPEDRKTLRAELFYFDPNRNSVTEWQKLGLSERVSTTILHYIEKGGRFRKAEDLQKIYGLNPAGYQRLLPYVRITGEKNEVPNTRQGYSVPFARRFRSPGKTDSLLPPHDLKLNTGTGFQRSFKKPVRTEINQADSATWSSLPGIGEKLAGRIIRFREKLGGFYEVAQVGETFGMQDSVFQKIKTFLYMNAVSLRQINLNTASREELQSHPYIRWKFSRQIMDYRRQHGNFQSVDDLLQLVQLNDSGFQKMKPYLSVQALP